MGSAGARGWASVIGPAFGGGRPSLDGLGALGWRYDLPGGLGAVSGASHRPSLGDASIDEGFTDAPLGWALGRGIIWLLASSSTKSPRGGLFGVVVADLGDAIVADLGDVAGAWLVGS